MDKNSFFEFDEHTYLAFTFCGFNHERTRYRPGHGGCMESIVHETLGHIFWLYTSSGLRVQHKDVGICNNKRFELELLHSVESITLKLLKSTMNS